MYLTLIINQKRLNSPKVKIETVSVIEVAAIDMEDVAAVTVVALNAAKGKQFKHEIAIITSFITSFFYSY